jgi:hypothetical protein
MESAHDALNSVFQGFPSLSDRSAPRRISVFGPMLRRGSDGFPCIAPWQYRNGDRRRELWRRLQQKFHRLRERGSDALDLPCETLKARPIQAAIHPAVSFSMGAAEPIDAAAIVPLPDVIIFVSATSLICLAALGALAARTSGANVATGIVRAALRGAPLRWL